MKKLLFVLVVLLVGGARADNVVTSREYVDTQANTLQTELPAKNTNTVLLNTATAGEVGEKAIYDTSAAFGAQTDALVTAGQFNTAVQNALESEFVCIERQNGNGGCLLYEIRGARPHTDQLPSGYTRLEYIGATGTQYIDTNIVPSEKGYHINTKLTLSSLPLSMGIFGYNYQDTDGIQRRQSFGVSGLAERLVFGYTDNPAGYANVSNLQIGQSYVIDALYGLRQATLMYNDTVVVVINNPSSRRNPKRIYLMAVNKVSSSSNAMMGRMYYATIWDTTSNNLLFNGIPARRDSDGVLGMYDTVTNTFFTNAGSGTFIAGPVVSSNLYLPSGN